jgi:uncharacterized membrane protein
VRISYWFWPSTLVLGALCMAAVVEWIDAQPSLMSGFMPGWMTAIDPDDARYALHTGDRRYRGCRCHVLDDAGGSVFYPDTFGSRLIGNLMRDRCTQISFGLLLGTFVLNIVILRSVQGLEVEFIPLPG